MVPGPPRLEPSTRGSFREKGRLLEPKSPSDRNVTLVCTRQGPGNSHCRPTVDIDNAGCQPHRGRFCPDSRARCDSGDRQCKVIFPLFATMRGWHGSCFITLEKGEKIMDTILIVLVLLFLFGGGGYYW